MRRKLPPADKKKRREARNQILEAANKRLRKDRQEPLNARQIQQAVFMCRQRLLVKPTVLVAAGYNPT